MTDQPGPGRGGARRGAGRKATGRTTRTISVAAPIAIADEIERRAKESGQTVHAFVLELLKDALATEPSE